MTVNPYVQVEDKHGAVASIFISSDNKHKVHYSDNKGKSFYTETFDGVSPELIEQSVIDWAEGKRELI